MVPTPNTHDGFKFDFDPENGIVEFECNCHSDFHMDIKNCKVEENMPIRDVRDLKDALNGLDMNDLIEMHQKFSGDPDSKLTFK